MGIPHRHRHVARRAGLLALWVIGSASAQEVPPAKVELTVAAGAPDAEQKRALAHGQGDERDDEPGRAEIEEARRTGKSSAGAGLSGTVGRVFTEHAPDGWFGRLELEGVVASRFEGAGAVGGVTLGGELWLAGESGGGGLPVSFWLGYRTPALIGSLGLGALMFEIDEVDGDRGFGIYAPFATAALGVELAGTRLLADARALYRWQWGAPDRAQLQLGLRMVHFIERPTRPAKQRRRGMLR